MKKSSILLNVEQKSKDKRYKNHDEVILTTQEIEMWKEMQKNATVTIKLKFPLTYMEIRHEKAYDMQSLVGNAGGYVGLFLGYAILQLPDLLLKLSSLLRLSFNRWQ